MCIEKSAMKRLSVSLQSNVLSSLWSEISKPVSGHMGRHLRAPVVRRPVDFDDVESIQNHDMLLTPPFCQVTSPDLAKAVAMAAKYERGVGRMKWRRVHRLRAVKNYRSSKAFE